MDHLPALHYSSQKLPRVPYLSSSAYRYEGPFKSFHERASANFPPTSVEDFSTSIQQWLFFGLLKEYFAIWALPVSDSDFVVKEDNVDFVTTRILDEYLIAAHATELQVYHKHKQDQKLSGTSGRDLEGRKDIRAAELLRVLKEAYAAILELDAGPRKCLLMPAIWDSIVLLASTLSRVAENVYKPEGNKLSLVRWPTEDFGSFRLRSIADLRDNQDWCPRERQLITDMVGERLPEMTFFTQIDRQEASHITHALCADSNACVAYQITDQTPYKTRHVLQDCQCEFVGLEPVAKATDQAERPSESSSNLLSRVLPKIATTEVEAVTFTNGALHHVTVPLVKTRASSVFRMPIPGANLVAISHVWADGLGNKQANCLPMCQLARLQQMVNDLFPEKQHPVPFWIDTLMIPAAKRPGEEWKKLEALRNMEWVYKGASKILVLDHGLLSVPIMGLGEEEVGARIMCSIWSRRLWTLQEGCIPDRTFFKFADQVMCWPELHASVRKRAKLSNWQKSSTLDQKNPVRQAQSLDWYQTRNKTSSWSLSGYQVNSEAGWPKFAALSLDERVFQTLYPVWHAIYMFLEDMTIQHHGTMRGEVLAHCMRGMFYRNCSKPEDEALVLASMLSKSPGAPAKYTKEPESPQDRYRLLFKDLEKIPRDILFVDQVRYQESGCRWIPTSLLKVNSASLIPMQRKDKVYNEWKWMIAISRKDSNLCVQTKKGLVVGLDGIRLPRTTRTPFSFRAYGKLWAVRLWHAGTTVPFEITTDGDWVLIPEAIITQQPLGCRAAFVQVETWAKDRRGGETKFVALAQLTDASSDGPNLPPVEVEYPTDLVTNWPTMTEADKEGLVRDKGGNRVLRDLVSDRFIHNDKWIVG